MTHELKKYSKFYLGCLSIIIFLLIFSIIVSYIRYSNVTWVVAYICVCIQICNFYDCLKFNKELNELKQLEEFKKQLNDVPGNLIEYFGKISTGPIDNPKICYTELKCPKCDTKLDFYPRQHGACHSGKFFNLCNAHYYCNGCYRIFIEKNSNVT